MKKTKNGKIALICLIMFICSGPAVFSQTEQFSIDVLQDSMKDFSDKLARSLPFNSTIGLNWADAFIGNFPRFGVGFSVGLTTMDLDSFKGLINLFSNPLPDWLGGFGGFPIPGWAAEARLGGFALPFDMGFKFGLMPIKNSANFEHFDYLLVGGDVRYAILKGNIILPTISVGVGFNYLSGSLGMTAGEDRKFAYENPLTGLEESIIFKAPLFTVDWSTASLDFKAQISKSFVIITPYLGIGVSTGWSKAGYGVKMEVDDSDSSGSIEDVENIFKKAGFNNFTPTGFSSETKPINGWNFRTFGGFALNLAVVRLEFTGFYNFVDKYGATIGFRIQL